MVIQVGWQHNERRSAPGGLSRIVKITGSFAGVIPPSIMLHMCHRHLQYRGHIVGILAVQILSPGKRK